MNRTQRRSSSSAPPAYLASARSTKRSTRSRKPPPVFFNRYSKKQREQNAKFIEEYKKRKGLSPISEGDESKPSPSSRSRKSKLSTEGTIQLKSQPILTSGMIKSKRSTLRSLWKGVKNILGLRKTKSAR